MQRQIESVLLVKFKKKNTGGASEGGGAAANRSLEAGRLGARCWHASEKDLVQCQKRPSTVSKET